MLCIFVLRIFFENLCFLFHLVLIRKSVPFYGFWYTEQYYASQQYSFFGKNQKDEEVINKIDKEIKDLVSDKKEPVAEDVPFWYGVFDDLNENFTFLNYDCIRSF